MSENMTSTTDTPVPPEFLSVSSRPDGSLVIEFRTKKIGPSGSDGTEQSDRINILPGHYERFREWIAHIDLAGRTVVATGRGPVEGYFAIGYYATLFRADRIVFEGANHTPRIEMPSPNAQPSDKSWLRIESQNGTVTVTCEKPSSTNGKWSEDEIGCSAPALLPHTALSVTFTGSGATHMYLLLGISAARAGLADVRVTKPAIPYAIRFTPEQAGETIAIASGKTGVVVGIIGDPNSGKSVFSRAFSMSLRESMPVWFQSWIYDCDLASPTPDWYCTALINAKSDAAIEKEYKALRDSQKVKWNSDMERRCANDLGILRTNLDLVIADLPGGGHPKEGEPYFEPKRISGESRANMFRQCDAFILICRKDRHDVILKGWIDALAKYGLQDRIWAILDSSEPNSEFSVSPLVPNEAGIFCGDIRGLDRGHPAGETGQKLVEAVRPLVRSLTAIPVVNAARAATATAFLTSDKGTRYGAAVRSASTGRIFAAGQYSSFNHSTNIHAEMNVLAQAATAGEPDVDILAITSTSSAEASPCGVCRQVILEHATRTGRDFDIALTAPGAHPTIVSVSKLLPHVWRMPGGTAAADIRDFPDVESIFNESGSPRIGSEFIVPHVHPSTPYCMALVWDDAFTHDTALLKFKYEQTSDDRWIKLPHAFTESAAYLRYLTDKRRGSRTFHGLATLKLPIRRQKDGTAQILFKNPIPLSGEMLRLCAEVIFAPAGIDAATCVFVTGSRMTGFATADSDWDLCVVATPKQIEALRARIAALAAEGRVTFPDKSRSWKLIKDTFPGATQDGGARIHAERRYAESFRLDDIPISFLFVNPNSGNRDFAFPCPFTTIGRTVISGRVIDASYAPYKRSESIIETPNHSRIRLLCYHKIANLLKEGDNISATGVLCHHAPDSIMSECQKTLVLSAPALDKLVWLP